MRAQDVAQRYAVRAMPTFKAFLDGKEVGEAVGAKPPAELEKLVAKCSRPQTFMGQANKLGSGNASAPASDDAAAAREARAKAAEARMSAMAQ